MKTLTGVILVLCACAAFTTYAADIDGKWIIEKKVGDADGKTYTHKSVLTLKNDNRSLTGTVVQTSEAPWMKSLNGRPIEISDGKVEGDKFSFKLTVENEKGQRVSVYEGVIGSDELKGTVKYRGIGITESFTAKRSE